MTDETNNPPTPETPSEVPAPTSSIPEDDIEYNVAPEDRKEEPVEVPKEEVASDDIPKDNPDAYQGYQFPKGKNTHVGKVDPVFRAVPEDGTYGEEPHVAGLPCDNDTLISLMNSYPSINFELGEQNREWASEITLGAGLVQQGNFLSKAVVRDKSSWSQRVQHGTSNLGITRPRLGSSGGQGQRISGELATLRARQALGLGAVHNIPLWHSGIWVTLKAPSTAARLELQRRIDEEKVDLGRRTDGLAFSNFSVYIKSYLVDFALAHLSTANVRYNQPLDLKDLILSTDIPTLIWGLLTTMYPNGYAYHQPCVTDPSKCQHITKEILDLNKICFTDTQRLTEAQKAHMSRRSERMEERDLEAYRKDHSYNSKGLTELATPYGKIKVQFKVPTITEYVASGFNWVDGIANAIEQAFGTDLTGERRNAYIMERAQATQLCEYSHWVKEIGLEDGSVIDDIDTVRKTLADISGEPKLSGSFFEQVNNYMEDVTISLIALPKMDCPACGGKPDAEEAAHPYLNPIDIEALFFTTLDQLLERVII